MEMHNLVLFSLTVVAFAAPNAAFEVDKESRWAVDAWHSACRALGYGRKQMAAFLRLDEGQWRKQFEAEGGQHVSAYRLSVAPIDVKREWIKRMAEDVGLRVFDAEDDIALLLDTLKAQAGQERRRA